jgi:hypothetical protein
MGIDLPDLFEVHITKQYFWNIFGTDKKPEERDIIWFPIIGRLFEINSVSPGEDEFMYKSTFWRVNLTTYQERNNITFDTQTQELIDDLHDNSDELYGIEYEEDLKRASKPLQYDVFTSLDDSLRKTINKNVIFNEQKLEYNYTILTKWNYDLSKSNNIAITYQYDEIINQTDDRSIMFWINPTFKFKYSSTSLITSIYANIDGNTSFAFNFANTYKIGDYVEIAGTENYDGTHKIISKSSNDITIEIPFINSNVTTPTIKRIDYFNLINLEGSINFIIKNNVCELLILNNTYLFDINNILDSSQWYCFIINISNTFKSSSVYIYQLNKVNNTNTIDKIFYKMYV